MSIRFKLLLSNILMIVIPLISAIILAIFLIGVGFGRTGINRHRPIEGVEKTAQDTFKEFITISNDALVNPDKFRNMEYLENIDYKLKKLNSGFGFMIKDNIYYLSDKIDRKEFESLLKEAAVFGNKDKMSRHTDKGEMKYFSHEFKMSNGDNCALFIFFDTSPISRFIGIFLSEFTIGFLLIVLITNGVLTFIVSQNIIKPLKKLKYGAEQIKDGNLMFSINEKSRDEVGDVCRAFEEMRKRLKDALEQQLKYDEERNEFIASISHDLKTPITSIKGHIDGLKDGVADTPEKNEKYLDIIYRKTIDMDRLINDLTFYSNQTLKKIPFNFSRVDLRSFIEDMADEYRLELERKGISIESNYNLGHNVLVKADVEKLKRVITNILENSLKYMNGENGRILIEVGDGQDKVLIGIHDNGEGIKKEALPYIFKRFYRADPSRNTSRGGSGLGLAIASQIIEEHGGRIWAESEYGKGTSIYFELEKIGEDYEKKNSDN